MNQMREFKRKAARLGAGKSNRLRKVFGASGFPLSKGTDRLATDIGDIAEACLVYLEMVRLLTTGPSKKSRKLVRESLENIQSELFLHMDYHLKGMKRPLKKTLSELEQ